MWVTCDLFLQFCKDYRTYFLFSRSTRERLTRKRPACFVGKNSRLLDLGQTARSGNYGTRTIQNCPPKQPPVLTPKPPKKSQTMENESFRLKLFCLKLSCFKSCQAVVPSSRQGSGSSTGKPQRESRRFCSHLDCGRNRGFEKRRHFTSVVVTGVQPRSPSISKGSNHQAAALHIRVRMRAT